MLVSRCQGVHLARATGEGAKPQTRRHERLDLALNQLTDAPKATPSTADQCSPLLTPLLTTRRKRATSHQEIAR